VPRLLHTSDLHIGDDYPPPVNGMKGVVDAANRERVDLVLFAGDTFHSNRVSQDLCDEFSSELARMPVPAIVLPGNHDPFDVECVWRRMTLPSHVSVIRERGGETLAFEDLDLDVWGRPHVSDLEDLSPLSEVPDPTGAAWHVAIAHGFVVRRRDDLIRSYQIHPDQIAQSRRHYVALGHWDFAADVSAGTVTAMYSGCPKQGKAALVELARSNAAARVSVSHVSLPDSG
jgi:DNA repair exonuclease SbcCD nuclease subunit